MGKRLPYTPNGRIRSVLRQHLWLRSRERAAALKAGNYCCAQCGVKQSVAKGREVKIEVHHRDGIDWDGVFAFIRERILQSPDKLEPLCEKCHEGRHSDARAEVEVVNIGGEGREPAGGKR